MNTFMNAYLVFCLLVFGSEAVAKSLPMKKVQTVETVWVPMDPSEVEETLDETEEVEVSTGNSGAVPLFKESVQEAQVSQTQPEVAEVEAGEPSTAKINGQAIQVETPPGERPIIQVIYQGVKPKKTPVPEKPKEKPMKQTVQPPPPPQPVVEEPSPVEKKKKGDVYNFYFSS